MAGPEVPGYVGDTTALQWAVRDLASIDAILPMVYGRDVCVQAGGNLGVFPKYLARVFRAVYCFEPSADLFPTMVRNAPEPNIVRFQAALGERPGLVGTVCSRRGAKKAPVHHGLMHVSGPGIIPTMRLDDLHLPVVDLLYLDLEGYELYALRGAVGTISRCKPVIAVEINQNIEFYGHAQDEVRQQVVSMGYQSACRVRSDEVFIPV